MKIIGIMACAQNGVVGNNGVIPWHYPEEFQHFRNVIGTSPVIMGRKTFETLPESILKDRKIIVLSRSFHPHEHPPLRSTIKLRNVPSIHTSAIPVKAGIRSLSQRKLETSPQSRTCLWNQVQKTIHQKVNCYLFGHRIPAVAGIWSLSSCSSDQVQGQALGPNLIWDNAGVGRDGEIEVAYMIGGAEIANLFLANNLLSEFILTKLHQSYQGDAILNIKAFENWKSCVINETADYCIYKLTP